MSPPAIKGGALSVARPSSGSGPDPSVTVKGLMAFRAGLATLLLVSAVISEAAGHNLENLATPFAAFGFGLLATVYLLTLIYGLLFTRLPPARHVGFSYVQIGIDLWLAALIVHATGGGHSGFFFLFFVDVVAVALLAERKGALWVTAASAVLLIGVCVLGYGRVLPPLPGQLVLPWEITGQELASRLVLNLAALLAVGVLAAMLAAQHRRVGERMTRNETRAEDLATLHENTIRCLTSGLVTLNLRGITTSANDAAGEILGVSARELEGGPLGERIVNLAALLEGLGERGTVRRAERSCVRPDGSQRSLGISIAPLSDHAGQLIGRVVHFQDLTDLRRMELAVERNERLAGIGRLAAAIAHEIRNPLASISGSVEVLRTMPGADPDSQHLIDIAVREVDRLNGLITDLLEYARPRTEERRPLDLGELVGEVITAFRREPRAAEQRVEVSFRARDAAWLEGAGGQLRQVIWNLLRNATEAMPKGGAIAIELGQERRPEHPRPDDPRHDDPPEVWLSVKDTGMGIAAADREHIFEPFFSTKKGGTGLGLATVARVVGDHHGEIELESEPGCGTTFHLRLPGCDAPPAAAPLLSPRGN